MHEYAAVALRGVPGFRGAAGAPYQLPRGTRKCHAIDEREVFLGALAATWIVILQVFRVQKQVLTRKK